MPNIGLPEIIIILVIVLLLFGSKKLPDLARSLGRSMRIMKSEVREMNNEELEASEQPAINPNPAPGYQQPANNQNPHQ
ncbi:MAG: Sec-independent protein translocase subunit TatA [Corynebacterium sp.]|nr:Sec-independent protein translocase subunit TatA [Corynebacterium sp.]